MNALYYDPSNHQVLDFVGGYDDLEDGIVRIIGDPETRYREDPVRMLRAIRFTGKLGLSLENDTSEPIRRLTLLLRDVSASRLFDEILKLLQAGYGRVTFSHLMQHGLLKPLFPHTFDLLESSDNGVYLSLIDLALRNTDARLAEGKSVTPAFLYAALHWPQVHHRWQELAAEGHGRTQSLTIASSETLDLINNTSQSQNASCATIREIWGLQVKLEKRHGRRPDSTLSTQVSRWLRLLLLRESAGEIMAGLGEWWTNYQVSDESQRRELVASIEEDFEEVPKRRLLKIQIP